MRRFFQVILLGFVIPVSLLAAEKSVQGDVSFFSLPEKTLKSARERRQAAEAAAKPLSVKDKKAEYSSKEPDDLDKLFEKLQKYFKPWAKVKEFFGNSEKQQDGIDKAVSEALKSQA